MPNADRRVALPTGERQYHIGLGPGDLAEYILLPGDRDRVARIAARLDSIERQHRHREFASVTGTYRGLRLSVLSTGIGTAPEKAPDRPAAPAEKPAEAKAPESIPADEESCVSCHTTDDTMTMDLAGGEKLPLYVDRDAYARSVHGDMLRCTDCHADVADYPHEAKPFKTRRDVTVAFYEQCKKCHFANYTKTLDGVHYALMAKGNKQAALCVDCHGAHAIGRPTEPRTKISETCSGCHQGVYQTYVKSVHGKALVAGNPDVPVCTDCHRAHDTTDPRDGALAMRTPEICGRCHTDEKLMTRYNLSTKVVDSRVAAEFNKELKLTKPGRNGASQLISSVRPISGWTPRRPRRILRPRIPV